MLHFPDSNSIASRQYDAWQYHMVQLENIRDQLSEDERHNPARVRSCFRENGLMYSDEDFEYINK